jgi:hypothetical protein
VTTDAGQGYGHFERMVKNANIESVDIGAIGDLLTSEEYILITKGRKIGVRSLRLLFFMSLARDA